MEIAVLAIIVLLGVAVIIMRKRSAKSEARPDERHEGGSKGDLKFHAVSLKLGMETCEAARSMAGRRYLSNAAPRIPLPGCDVNTCDCRFVHHKDRREGEDRRSPFRPQFGGIVATQVEKDKRNKTDRRDDPSDNFEF